MGLPVSSCSAASAPTTRTVFSSQYTLGAADQKWQWNPYGTNYTGSYGYNGWLYTGNYSISAVIIGTSDDWKYASPMNTLEFIGNSNGGKLLAKRGAWTCNAF